MSAPQYAAKVDANQQTVVDALRRVGCTVEITSQIGNGFPDLLVYTPFLCRNLLLEVKDGNKPASKRKLTPGQRRWHRDWPADVYVVKDVDEALRVVGAP